MMEDFCKLKYTDVVGYQSPNHTMAHEVWFEEPITKMRVPIMIHEKPCSPIRYQSYAPVYEEALFWNNDSIETCYLMTILDKHLFRIMKDRYKTEQDTIGLVFSKMEQPNQPCWPFQYIQLRMIVRDWNVMKWVADDLKYKLEHCDNYVKSYSESMIPYAVKPIDNFEFVVGSSQNRKVIYDFSKREEYWKQTFHLGGHYEI